MFPDVGGVHVRDAVMSFAIAAVMTVVAGGLLPFRGAGEAAWRVPLMASLYVGFQEVLMCGRYLGGWDGGTGLEMDGMGLLGYLPFYITWHHFLAVLSQSASRSDRLFGIFQLPK